MNTCIFMYMWIKSSLGKKKKKDDSWTVFSVRSVVSHHTRAHLQFSSASSFPSSSFICCPVIKERFLLYSSESTADRSIGGICQLQETVHGGFYHKIPSHLLLKVGCVSEQVFCLEHCDLELSVLLVAIPSLTWSWNQIIASWVQQAMCALVPLWLNWLHWSIKLNFNCQNCPKQYR